MANIKFIANQAKTINLYKNIRSKLLKYCAKIYFNKQCLVKKVIPKYGNLKFINTSPVSQVTTKKAQVIRTKDEIKFLFKKKEKLNYDLYIFYMKAAQVFIQCLLLWTEQSGTCGQTIAFQDFCYCESMVYIIHQMLLGSVSTLHDHYRAVTRVF